jgi:arginine/ornithine transport system ATP-binding protein
MSAASLVVDNLHKRYGDREVLKGVSLAAKPGDVITLIGSSGSGKSTFLRCLNLLEQPYEGTLRLGDEQLKLVRDRDGSFKAGDAAQLQSWRARLAMVFQNFNLWGHRTVLENVIEAPVHVLKQSRAEAIEKAEALLARVGVSHRKDVYPAQLSGGEQQRVAIARALAGPSVKPWWPCAKLNHSPGCLGAGPMPGFMSALHGRLPTQGSDSTASPSSSSPRACASAPVS